MYVPIGTIVASPFWSWLHRLGGIGLILLGIADNSLVPLPGSVDVFTILLAAHNRQWWFYYALMATAGAVLGGYLTYRLAEKGGEETLEKRIGKKKAKAAYRRFEKRESRWVFVGAILPPPFPLVPVLMAAGILHHPKNKFLTALAAGRAIRYFALAYIGRVYGAAIIGFLAHYYRPVLYGMIALAVLGAAAALIYYRYYRPAHEKKAGASQKLSRTGGGNQKAGKQTHPEERHSKRRTA